MVPIRTEEIPESTQLLVQMTRILSHETRATIVKILFLNGETAYSDLLKAINIPQSTLSGHIASLSIKGALKVRISGKYYFYELVEMPDFFVQVIQAIEISKKCQSYFGYENKDTEENIIESQEEQKFSSNLNKRNKYSNQKKLSEKVRSNFLLQVGTNDYIYTPPSFEELRENGFSIPISRRPKFRIIPLKE
jgi:DNA-binding transcriptional ArsR family regulator